VLVAGTLLRSARGALILAVAMSLSLLVAVTILYVAGATLKHHGAWRGSLVALAVVIDDAIIDVDGFIARLREREAGAIHRRAHPRQRRAKRAARRSTRC